MLRANYPLIPVVVMPCTKYFCREKNRMKHGTRDNTDMANIEPHEETLDESRKSLSPRGTVKRCGEFKKIIWEKKSSQVHKNVKSTVVMIAGTLSGTMIFAKIPNLLQPSIQADSSMSLGRLRMNCTSRKIKKASPPKNFGTIKG